MKQKIVETKKLKNKVEMKQTSSEREMYCRPRPASFPRRLSTRITPCFLLLHVRNTHIYTCTLSATSKEEIYCRPRPAPFPAASLETPDFSRSSLLFCLLASSGSTKSSYVGLSRTECPGRGGRDPRSKKKKKKKSTEDRTVENSVRIYNSHSYSSSYSY